MQQSIIDRRTTYLIQLVDSIRFNQLIFECFGFLFGIASFYFKTYGDSSLEF